MNSVNRCQRVRSANDLARPRNLLAHLAVFGCLLGLGSVACDRGHADESTSANSATEQAIAKLSVDELAQKLSSDAPPTVFDANSSSTREKFGVIPGAKLLSSSSDYDVAASLPGDKAADLVFYCSNTRCTAAEGAAGRAVEAGYRSVSVLPEGIKGWVNAGQSTNNI